MRKGRTIIFLAAALLCGNYLSEFAPKAPAIYLTASFVLAIAALKWNDMIPITLSFFLAGIASFQIQVLGAHNGTTAVSLWAAGMKWRFSNFLGRIIPPGDEISILRALTIGDKSDISREIKNNFRTSGAAHLLALSGLHVGLIYKMISYSLFFIGGSRRMQLLRKAIILILLWVFATITGLSPSIFRAVLMITIYEAGGLFGAAHDGPVALWESALLITLVNPSAPREISFQLSFLACIGIFVFYPRMKMMLSTGSRALNYIWSGTSLAISCQIATAPLSYFYFGTFPRYFLLTNLLTVPLSAAILYLAAGSIITLGMPTVGALLSKVLALTIQLLSTIVELISRLGQ